MDFEIIKVSNTTHKFCIAFLTLEAVPHQRIEPPLILLSLLSRMLTSIKPFFLVPLSMVSMYLIVGFPRALIPSIYMASTVLVIIWLSSLPCHRSRFYITCVQNCCRFPDLLISYMANQPNASHQRPTLCNIKVAGTRSRHVLTIRLSFVFRCRFSNEYIHIPNSHGTGIPHECER